MALALDSLGLVYIVIDQCEEESKANGTVFDEMKVNSGELARFGPNATLPLHFPGLN